MSAKIEFPENIESHRQSWIGAMERLIELEPESSEPDEDEKGFWRHELKAMSDMYADMDRIKADQHIDKLASDAELYLEIQIAADSLPSGWEISIRVENGFAGVDLIDPHGTLVDLDGADETLGESVASAVDFAKNCDKQIMGDKK